MSDREWDVIRLDGMHWVIKTGGIGGFSFRVEEGELKQIYRAIEQAVYGGWVSIPPRDARDRISMLENELARKDDSLREVWGKVHGLEGDLGAARALVKQLEKTAEELKAKVELREAIRNVLALKLKDTELDLEAANHRIERLEVEIETLPGAEGRIADLEAKLKVHTDFWAEAKKADSEPW